VTLQELTAKLRLAYGKGCFTRQKDYWTYEVCPYQKVRQFHKEGEHVSMDFSLGLYEPGSDELAGGVISQRFVGGSSDRRSAVRFSCSSELAEQKALLTDIKEPRSQFYEFEIRTPLVCQSAPGEDSPDMYLRPLEGECVYMNTGWWTYKFCYGGQLTQFHRESVVTAQSDDKAAHAAPAAPAPPQIVTTAEFDLGRYQTENSKMTLVKGESPSSSYASQWFEGGTSCDILNGKPRRTEVRYYCDPNENQALRNIKETSTCEYVVHVATRLLCAHKTFAPEQPKVNEIECSPISPIAAEDAQGVIQL